MNQKELLKITQSQKDKPGVLLPDFVQDEIREHPEDVVIWEWTNIGLVFKMRNWDKPMFFQKLG